MEEKLIVEDNKDFIGIIRQVLDVKQVDVMSYSPLTLAYIGDDAYDLVIRTYLLGKGNMPVNKLNRMADGLVRAKAQSDMMDVIEPMLDEEEHAVYKRGRNAKSYTKAKNTTVADYRRATGFEALMGYLYLQRRYERMLELIKMGLDSLDNNEEQS